jgi:hypothetical protein
MADKKIYVFVDASVTPDGKEAKTAVTKDVTKKITEAITSRALGALPDTYSNKDSDKPKDKSDNFAANSVRIVADLDLKAETAGSALTVSCKLKVQFEGVKLPKKKGPVMGIASSSANVKNRGTVARNLVGFTEEVLDSLVAPLISKIVSNPAYLKYAEGQGLPV